ncbi:Annexin A8 [Manis javanica]|nr:Annexin A8 [Manis javanica]
MVKGSQHFNPDPDVETIYKAMKGIGTKKQAIIDVLMKKSNAVRQQIVKSFKAQFSEGTRDDVSSFVDLGLALHDAQDLYAAGEKIRGTGEMKFITILCTRSAMHLMRVFEEYEKIANKSIEDSIKSETHRSLEKAMLTVAQDTETIPAPVSSMCYVLPGAVLCAAHAVPCALREAGTHDGTLIRNIVSRSEIDFNLIKRQFKKIYGKTLSSMVMVARE